jgi:hypothetical protein
MRPACAILSDRVGQGPQRLHVGVLDRDRLGVEVNGRAQLADGILRVSGHVVLPEREPCLRVRRLHPHRLLQRGARLSALPGVVLDR